MMDTQSGYIKHVIVKCKARYILYHTNARRWSIAHWTSGVVSGLIAAGTSLMSFIAQQQGWDNTVGMVGGLILTISTSIITSLKIGQNQNANEKAGDAYRNLEEKILAEFSADNVDYEELKNRCQEKLEKLTNQYPEPNPQKCIHLEEMWHEKMFPTEEV
jgi:hypothetical protein